MKTISFSLWGSLPKYNVGAIKNALLARAYYPSWTCKYHVANDVPSETVDKLQALSNVIIKKREELSGWRNSTLWRFEDMSNPDIEIMISRDTDSRLNMREADAVNEWIKSDKGFHVMKDHPGHSVPILAGAFGCKNGTIPNILELINDFSHEETKQNDQHFLWEKIWPLVKENTFTHDDGRYGWRHGRYGWTHDNPFPTPRLGGFDKDNNPINFVGKALDEHDKPC